MLIVLNSGSLNLLEPSRPVQDCHGIALHLLLQVLRQLLSIQNVTNKFRYLRLYCFHPLLAILIGNP